MHSFLEEKKKKVFFFFFLCKEWESIQIFPSESDAALSLAFIIYKATFLFMENHLAELTSSQTNHF